ncbi:MAG: hypothetical protein IJG37_10005 [Synergistaceae bacterium]|nr:hypothetical protein [Synergistaceae bacterium]MBQ7168636.1 hypothetical protein [Synergistaceae bacterium]
MSTEIIEKGNTVLETPSGLYDDEADYDLAEFEDILARPERHKGYMTAGEMLRDMGLI